MGESAKQVNTLVGDIASASQEQAQGIEQLNQSIQEIDRVVQQNVSNAEGSASAANQIRAQSQRLRDIVTELTSLVQGNQA